MDGLAYKPVEENVTPEQLKEIFGRHGEVTKVVLPPGKGGQAKPGGFGFIHFAERSSALKAVKITERYEIDGHAVEVTLAKPQTDRKYDGASNSYKSGALPTYAPYSGYGYGGDPYGGFGAGYGGGGYGQTMIYGRGPMPAGMRMVPMVLPDGRLGYVLVSSFFAYSASPMCNCPDSNLVHRLQHHSPLTGGMIGVVAVVLAGVEMRAAVVVVTALTKMKRTVRHITPPPPPQHPPGYVAQHSGGVTQNISEVLARGLMLYLNYDEWGRIIAVARDYAEAMMGEREQPSSTSSAATNDDNYSRDVSAFGPKTNTEFIIDKFFGNPKMRDDLGLSGDGDGDGDATPRWWWRSGDQGWREHRGTRFFTSRR
ncbi:Polyadenylate-binding protein RBP45C [Acorus gramineus]|uniref:Polyadenylate-binding protein RBP45C n=1 Tax=Acorus gramineus TaxID=55184 RepID=A0AAV9B7U3_ACOGR|nr:Polyadenylate-binding protein RBP45C [Acorus gramineus]